METLLERAPELVRSCERCAWLPSCALRPEQRGRECSRGLVGNVRHRGYPIVRQGQPATQLYLVRSGSAKSVAADADGNEQVTGFHLPGDIVGLDGLANGLYQSSIVALESCSICALSAPAVSTSPEQLMQLLRVSAQQAVHLQAHELMLGQKAAHARFATFLLDLSGRLGARGFSRGEFNLSMSRQDIANYLSLAVETVSRLFSEFKQLGIIDVERRFVQLRDTERLQVYAQGDCALRLAAAG